MKRLFKSVSTASKATKKLLIACLLLSSAFTGCAGNNGNDNEPGAFTPDSPVSQSNIVKPSEEKEYIPSEMKGTISISVLDDEDLLNMAADLFMNKYPDVEVTINTFRTADNNIDGMPSDEFSTENYLTQLNTKIMTGKAEDIILTDPLPMKKYTDMGAFEDLSFFLSHSPEINEENQHMNVFDLMKGKDGELWEIPLFWSPPFIMYFDKALVDDSNLSLDASIQSMCYEDGLMYGKQLIDSANKENTLLEMGNSAQAAESIILDNLDSFIDLDNKQVKLDSEEFVKILHKAKELETQGYYDIDGKIDFYNMEYYIAYAKGPGVMIAYNSLDPDSNMYHPMPLSDANGNVNMRTSLCFGINSKSDSKELAWEFLKFMLSDEVQTPALYGFFVNKKSFDAYVEMSFLNISGNPRNQVENKESITKEDYRNLLLRWMSQINGYTRPDKTIEKYINEEIGKFFDGEQSAEETAKTLQSKLDKYLNE